MEIPTNLSRTNFSQPLKMVKDSFLSNQSKENRQLGFITLLTLCFKNPFHSLQLAKEHIIGS
jgi:hypothetical protein